MAKVCLTYPRDINLNFFPLGIGYLGSYLQAHGHTVMILDLGRNDLSTLTQLQADPPDLIGLSITSTQLAIAKEMIAHLRREVPTAKLVAGGIHPSYFKQSFITDFGVDFVVYGEGEITLLELCDALDRGDNDFASINGLVYRGSEEIEVNPPRELMPDIDILPMPLREAVNYDTYLQPPGLIRGIWTNRCANLTTSRGCPGRCTYCAVNYITHKTYRRRSVDNVLLEIDHLVERYQIDSFFMMDDTFLMKPSWIDEFCEKFIARKYNLIWTCFGRIDTVNARMLRAVKAAGCVQIEYGIESCSDYVLKHIKKKITQAKIRKVVKLSQEAGLRVFSGFMMGFPEEREEDIQETIDCARELKLDFSTCYFAIPYPGTELYARAQAEDRILEPDLTKWYIRSSNIWRVNLDEATLIEYRNRFLRSCRWRNLACFLKNPIFLLRALGLFICNLRAVVRALIDSFRHQSWDDFGYYLYVHMSAGMAQRNHYQYQLPTATSNAKEAVTTS